MLKHKIIPGILSILFFASNLIAQDIPSGVKLIKNEKYNEAKKYFTSLLNTPSKAEAYFYLGEIYFIEENVDSAKICYTKGIEANIEFPLNYAGMVRLNVLDGNDAEIAKNRDQAIELSDSENPEVFIVLAEAYMHIKYYDTAKQFMDKAIENKLTTAEIYITIGKVHLGKINGTEAIKNFEEALRLESGNPEALTLKAQVYSLINNYGGAISLLTEAINSDPSYSHAYYELAEVYANVKDYTKASEYYAMYIEKSESTPEKQKRYASTLYLNKEYEKAITILEKLIQTEPDNASSIRIIAYSYLRLDAVEASKYYFNKLFSLSGIDYQPTDYENYADLLSKTNNDSLALEYLSKITDLDSTRKDIYGKMSILYFKNKNWNGVISSLESKGDLTAQEYFDLGKAYYFTQKYNEADVAFNMLTSKVPDLAIAYFWQARVKTNFDPESDSGLAKPYYEQFLQISNEDTTRFKKELIEAYSYLGYYYYLKTDNANSKLYWQKVYAIDPKNVQAVEALKNL
jgi:tetratricopeptide (TPR) repeat protein